MARPQPLSKVRRNEISRYVSGRSAGPVVLDEDGWDSVVAIADECVYRFPRGKWAIERVESEIAFLRAFATLSPVAIPAPTLNEAPLHTVYRLVPGDPLMPSRLAEWSQQQRRAAAATLGEFLSALHGFSAERALSLGLKPDAWAEAWWEQDDDKFRRHVLPLLGSHGRKLAEHVMETVDPAAMHVPRQATVHNDLGPEHILSDGVTITGVIDFGDAAVGDPALDFQWSILYRHGGMHYENAFLDAVLENYPHAIDDAFFVRVKAYRIYHGLREVRDEAEFGTPTSLKEAVDLFERAAEKLLS